MTIRERRVENEWGFLLRLAAENPEIMEATGREQICGAECFYIGLKRTSGIQLNSGTLEVVNDHRVTLRFAEYFPCVPIEAFLSKPVFHPNVHPENGFVCLWSRFSPGDSVIEAVRQLQRVISWELFNAETDHLMQPEALVSGRPTSPLPYQLVRIPDDLNQERAYTHTVNRKRRTRLTRPD